MMIKSIFNKYDNLVFETIDELFTHEEIYGEYYARTFEGDFNTFIYSNNLPILRHWNDYFWNQNSFHHPTKKRKNEEEEFEFWNEVVKNCDTYANLEKYYGGALDSTIFLASYQNIPYDYVTENAKLKKRKERFIVENGILAYYRQLEKSLVEYEYNRRREQNATRNELLGSENYDPRDYRDNSEDLNYNDDLDLDQQSPDFWNRL